MSPAEKHLRACYPKLEAMFDFVGPVPSEQLDQRPLVIVVADIVAGQMLSGQAADTICGRMRTAVKNRQLDGPHKLTTLELQKCGLSKAKVRTIQEFSVELAVQPSRFQKWPELPYPELKREVSSFWGLSDWTAEMLAITHFGHTDVYPTADGTIRRATNLIRQNIDPKFDPKKGSPHRTKLSRYLWKSIDLGYWSTS